MSGVTTRGRAQLANSNKSDVPANKGGEPVPAPENATSENDEKEAEAAERARLKRLSKHEDIKLAWSKRNKMIFKAAGKMTSRAYSSAVGKIVWEDKFLVKGTKKQDVVLEKNFALGNEEPSIAANALNLKSGHNILADMLQRYVRKEFSVDIETGTASISNAIWTNILKQLPRLPEGYQWHHLKRQVLANTLLCRHELYDILKPHVNKTDLSYSEICEHFANAKGNTVMPHAAGDFIIFAVRHFIQQPIVIVKPFIKPKKKKSDDNEYGYEKVYMDEEDKKLAPEDFGIVMVFNGLNYYAPAMENVICDLSDDLTSVRTHTVDALERANELITKLPPSGCKDSLSKVTLHMRAAKEFLRATHVTTGTTNIAPNYAMNIPVPLSSRAKVTRPLLFARPANPAKKKKKDNGTAEAGAEKDGEGDDNKEDEEKELAEQYTGRAEGQCVCGEQFEDQEQMDVHYRVKHKELKNYTCIGKKINKEGEEVTCGESFDRGDTLWTHFRKVHLKIYQYHCNLSPNCKKKIEERARWLYHKEVIHKIGRTTIRCKYCDKPISQICKVKDHRAICSASGTKKEEKIIDCRYCTKLFHSRQYYLNHISTVHAKEAGVKQVRHHCNVCGRDYANASSLKNHECRPQGTKRKCHSKESPDSTTE